MTLKDCYTSLGGNFDEVLGRLRREQTVQKFIYKFLDDKSYSLFETSMANQDYDEALRAVHTIKGICQNLSFTKLYEISNAITQVLKEGDYNKAAEMAPQLAKDYSQTIHAIGKGSEKQLCNAVFSKQFYWYAAIQHYCFLSAWNLYGAKQQAFRLRNW